MIGRLRTVLIGALVALALWVPSYPTQSQEQTVGLFLNGAGSYDGYTLFATGGYTTTYLIDNNGNRVHSWDSDFRNLASVYLLDNGNILRTAILQWANDLFPYAAGGGGGLVEELAWDGTPVWRFEYADEHHLAHHDVEKLPNGNVLIIAWERKTSEEALAAGRNPYLLIDGELLLDSIIEVEPTGPTGGDIVWEWHAWDHLIQDYDPAKANYGVVGDHPELIDFNYSCTVFCFTGFADWTHFNAVDYNPDLDQIILSIAHFSEFWVIDHSTTTEEAAGHSGGSSGKGGDLLYRWGNPQAYRASGAEDQKLFRQHDAQWIEPGLAGEGRIMVFNNGLGRYDGNYSSVEEIVPPVDGDGNYLLTPGSAYGPEEPAWIYTSEVPTDFFSVYISGAQRLPNGNTLVCAGAYGEFFEVSPTGETVWRYVNPVTSEGPVYQGSDPWGNATFRAYRYGPDFPGLAGKDLTPSGPIELYPQDTDADGLWDHLDNCPLDNNPDQSNTDHGRRPNGSAIAGDWASNPSQDALGDACDPDNDNDGLPDVSENDLVCPYRLTGDSDGDGMVDGFEVANDSNACDVAVKPACTDTADSDSDGLMNCLEHFGYNTCASGNDEVPGWSACANPVDSDSDGCADVLEVMDINGDRKVAVGDLTLLAKRGAGIVPASDSDPIFDVNKDGKISVGDLTLMAKNTCNLKPWLLGCPVCPPE